MTDFQMGLPAAVKWQCLWWLQGSIWLQQLSEVRHRQEGKTRSPALKGKGLVLRIGSSYLYGGTASKRWRVGPENWSILLIWKNCLWSRELSVCNIGKELRAAPHQVRVSVAILKKKKKVHTCVLKRSSALLGTFLSRGPCDIKNLWSDRSTIP